MKQIDILFDSNFHWKYFGCNLPSFLLSILHHFDILHFEKFSNIHLYNWQHEMLLLDFNSSVNPHLQILETKIIIECLLRMDQTLELHQKWPLCPPEAGVGAGPMSISILCVTILHLLIITICVPLLTTLLLSVMCPMMTHIHQTYHHQNMFHVLYNNNYQLLPHHT